MLTPELVARAWAMLQAGHSRAETARALGVPQSTLGMVANGQTYREITKDLPPLPPTRKGRPFKAPGPAVSDPADQAGGNSQPGREPRQ
jgi:hypothetical protein